MIRALPLLLLFAAAPAAARPAEFEPSAERFADAAACSAHLSRLVADARGAGIAAAEGPYAFEGEVRAHIVRAVDRGHRISEYRCQAERLSSRSWSHDLEAAEEEFTVEAVARNAPWLRRGR